MDYVIKVDLHFVHIWGIEFILNLIVMHLVSARSPRKNDFTITDVGVVEMVQWKYTKALSWGLVIVTILIYILLGSVG